jgi:CheY-like chemotaxis protein
MAKVDPTFLYIEDDALSRRVIQILLVNVLGFSKVTLFENTANLQERISAMPAAPNVIFLDVQMRPLNGFEALKILRSDARFEAATMIAMTANVMSHDIDALKKAGFDGLIGKPIMNDVFPQLIEKILDDEPVWFVP